MLLKTCVVLLSFVTFSTFAQVTFDERLGLQDLVEQVFGNTTDPAAFEKCGFRNSEGVGPQHSLTGKTEFGKNDEFVKFCANISHF